MRLESRISVARLWTVIVLLVGHLCSAVNAFEGELNFPAQGNSELVFSMSARQADVDPSDVLKVFVGSRNRCCEGRSAITGRYTLLDSRITFTPAFEFSQRQIYTVEIPDRDLEEFAIGRTIDTVKPEIIAIYPSGNDIPENTLRFYIHFSTPMQPHVSRDYIKLQDDTGKTDTAAFMAFKQELWSENRTRLTLLLDPGRIKRGVSQNLSLGPALLAGHRYSIVVDGGWATAHNAAKMPRFEHTFTVSKPLRTLPNPDQWTITSPGILTSDPLIIEFDRPFDNALLPNALSVLDNAGLTVPGVVTIGKQERIWRFDPAGSWRNSRIHIVLNTQLEDVAGNNFIDLLDHAVGTGLPTPKSKTITINLEPRRTDTQSLMPIGGL